MESDPRRMQEAKRVGRFGVAGVLSTLLDYIIFIGITKLFSLPLDRVWAAKLVSGAVAMVNSYALNRTWVFKHRGAGVQAQVVRFLAVTIIGVFVIQLGLVQLFSSVIPAPGQALYDLLARLHLLIAPALVTRELVIKTVAFGLATLASLSWNYLAYRKLVFV